MHEEVAFILWPSDEWKLRVRDSEHASAFVSLPRLLGVSGVVAHESSCCVPRRYAERRRIRFGFLPHFWRPSFYSSVQRTSSHVLQLPLVLLGWMLSSTHMVC